MVSRGRKRTHTLIVKSRAWSSQCCGLALVVKCSEILAHIELPFNRRVNKVFTHSLTHSGWLEMIEECGIMTKEFVHTIRKRFHEVEATGIETVYLLHVFLFSMLSSSSLGSQFDTPLNTDSPLPFSFDKRRHLVASINGFSLQIYSFRLYVKHFLFAYIIVFFFHYSKMNL